MGWSVTAVMRRSDNLFADHNIKKVFIDNLDGETDWGEAVNGIDIIVHLAARVHVMADNSLDPTESFRKVNVDGTRNLAEYASRAGVRRFVYLSSVKVNGEGEQKPYSEVDEPLPKDAYGISKMESESQLKNIADKSGMDFVIIRPPLVYGPGVKANFLRLLNLVYHRIPLPFKNLSNNRSLVFIGNLIDCIAVCMKHPQAVGQTFFVSDGQDLSTEMLVRLIAKEMNRSPIIYPIPKSFMRTFGKLTGREKDIDRLTNSLRVDIGKVRKKLNWHPPFTIEQGIKETCKWFMANR